MMDVFWDLHKVFRLEHPSTILMYLIIYKWMSINILLTSLSALSDVNFTMVVLLDLSLFLLVVIQMDLNNLVVTKHIYHFYVFY